VLVRRWLVGFHAGELARTRRLAVFKRRVSAKKQRKRVQLSAQARRGRELHLQRIRQVKMGQRRRSIGAYNPGVERQLRGILPA
jgi:hypothetical protein